jgi:hypothetical protein
MLEECNRIQRDPNATVVEKWKAASYGLLGTWGNILPSMSYSMSKGREAMSEARQSIDAKTLSGEYSTTQAIAARTAQFMGSMGFGVTSLVNDPVNSVPIMAKGVVQLPQKTITDSYLFYSQPSVKTGADFIEDATAIYGIYKSATLLKPTLSASETTIVSRWGKSGLEPDNWVMKGDVSFSTFLRSFKWEPEWLGGNRPVKFGEWESSGQSYSVPSNTLHTPSGWEGFKAVFGQRVYNPNYVEPMIPKTPPAILPFKDWQTNENK